MEIELKKYHLFNTTEHSYYQLLTSDRSTQVYHFNFTNVSVSMHSHSEAKLCFAKLAPTEDQWANRPNITDCSKGPKILVLERTRHSQYSMRLRHERSQVRAQGARCLFFGQNRRTCVSERIGKETSLWKNTSLGKCKNCLRKAIP